MNFKSVHSFVFVLLLALMASNLHLWQAHAEDSVCEVCLLTPHNAIPTDEAEIHVLMATLAVHNWQNVKSQHLIEGALIEPIRGSPFLIS